MIPFLTFLASVTYIAAQQGNPGCLLRAVAGNPRMFQVNTPYQANRMFPCPENTLFDANQCGCGWVENPINKSPDEISRQTGGMGGVGGTMTPGMVNPGAGIGGQIDQINQQVSTTRPPCTLRAHADRHKYEEFILGFDWMLRSCPMGTLFNLEQCACHDIDPNQKYTCQPELWINFNGKEIEDSAGYQISIGNNGNVVNVSNAGRFDGTGTLTVWQYANQDLGTQLTVNLRFYEFPGGVSDEQVLVSNCYGRQLGSVEVALNQQTKVVIFRLEARIGRYPEGVEISIPYREKAWKNVTLAYDGNMVTAQVDEEIKSQPLKGRITSRFNGLLIGSCNGRGFVGYLDDLRVYRCLLGNDMAPMAGPGGEMGMGGGF
ncbi:shell matrix protein-like [Dreissena polymorpha]|uniref:Uncharacterized protein n=1 Tax=Dreissena polymorpha TaxID=45954 RepID=A0A9D4NBQ5_DREPO|nr:shell matrix protein-like [Dreissena polymorpha]KAH3891475.1 hypothetical protein DPMN_015577 [Dreissena polymorpha]